MSASDDTDNFDPADNFASDTTPAPINVAKASKPNTKARTAIGRAVTTTLAVVAASHDVLELLASLTGVKADITEVAIAVAAGTNVENLTAIHDLVKVASGAGDMAEAMAASISIATADRDTQKAMWALLVAVGDLAGRVPATPGQTALGIMGAATTLPAHAINVLSEAAAVQEAGNRHGPVPVMAACTDRPSARDPSSR